MRRRTAASAGALALLAISCSSCSDRDVAKVVRPIVEKVMDRIGMEMLLRDLGPQMLTSVVGASAPTGGPALLNGLCADANLRMLLRRGVPEL
jgi:hypothetical protein